MKGSKAAMTDPEMANFLPARWLLSFRKLRTVKPVKNPTYTDSTPWWQTANIDEKIILPICSDQKRWPSFEFQSRLLALRSKAMCPMTSPANCCNSLAWPPTMLMTTSRLSSSHIRVPLSQSRHRSRTSFVVLYSRREYWPLTPVVPMTFLSHDTQ